MGALKIVQKNKIIDFLQKSLAIWKTDVHIIKDRYISTAEFLK